jgi:hypothetical protein
MPFDISETLEKMLDAVKSVAKEDWPKIEGYAKTILQNERVALANLAELRVKGELTEEEFKSELQDEKDTVEAELLAAQVLGKAAVQKAANAAIKVFTDAVLALLLQKAP